MAVSRYAFSRNVIVGDKRLVATNQNSSRIFKAVSLGAIPVSEYIITESERLDTISAATFGTSDYWWVLAATSGIGWGLQVPPGTIILIPKNLNDVFNYVR